MSFFWNKQSTNSPAFPDGLPFPLTGVRKTVGGTVGGNQYRFNLDRTFSPTLMAHLGLGFWRFHNPDSSPPDILNYDVMKNLGLVGSATGIGFPTITGLSYNNEGGIGNTMGIQNSVFQQTDIASTVGSLTWIHGKHTYKAGFEIKDSVYSDQSNNQAAGQYNFSGAQTAIPFLNSTRPSAPDRSPDRSAAVTPASCWARCKTTKSLRQVAAQHRSIQEGLYVQDSIKVTSKLTLEIGLRWDRTPLGHEEWDRQSEISFSTPNPNAGDLPGGTVFAGYGPGRCNCEFVKTYNFGFRAAAQRGLPDQQQDRDSRRLGNQLRRHRPVELPEQQLSHQRNGIHPPSARATIRSSGWPIPSCRTESSTTPRLCTW